jgi:hypothetical protein
MSNKKKTILPDTATDATAASVTLALEAALTAVQELSTARTAAKLSTSRLRGVARELRELIKVMSVL